MPRYSRIMTSTIITSQPLEAGTPVRHVTRVPSPLGTIEITSDGAAIIGLSIESGGPATSAESAETPGSDDTEISGGAFPQDDAPDERDAVLENAAAQLAEYFAGTRREFDLPVVLAGTEFQRAVWEQLRQVRWGEVTSYGAIGKATGRPMAGRAVGGAIGANPVPIIVGCHRVLATGGRITGYSAGRGVLTKKWLLDHEQVPHS